MATSEIPLEPMALLNYSDGSVRVVSIDDALDEMSRYPDLVQAYAFMGCQFEVADEEETDEPVEPAE